MLVLARRVGEEIVIGEDVRIVVVETTKGIVRLGVTAPRQIQVDRKEIADRRKQELIAQEGRHEAGGPPHAVPIEP
jgi:carbon storage regulator